MTYEGEGGVWAARTPEHRAPGAGWGFSLERYKFKFTIDGKAQPFGHVPEATIVPTLRRQQLLSVNFLAEQRTPHSNIGRTVRQLGAT